MGVTKTYRMPGDSEEFNRVKSIILDMQMVPREPWQVTVIIMHHKNIQSGAEMCLLKGRAQEVAVHTRLTDNVVIEGVKLSSFIDSIDTFRQRQCYNLEGTAWELGDLKVKLGQAQLSGDTKLCLLEVEFAAAHYLSHAEKVIDEFVCFLDPSHNFSCKRADYARYRLNAEEWSAKHTALDLLVAMNCLGAR
mmetsp:Transcript_5810/g.10350  ORF Transcript_5810/g.10350 Transcript_5810/m.10350 type:complete len:192 (-) Transcript_5810:1558-2133(-)